MKKNAWQSSSVFCLNRLYQPNEHVGVSVETMSQLLLTFMSENNVLLLVGVKATTFASAYIDICYEINFNVIMFTFSNKMPSLKLSLDREGTDEDANETFSVGLSSPVTSSVGLKHEVIVAGSVT